MRENELRIGVYINLNGQVEQIENSDNFKSFELYEPIPLTEEWLLKFGFTRQNNAWNGPHINDFSLWNPKGVSEFTLNDTIFIPRVEFVHQLQNLYFALTGEELVYNQGYMKQDASENITLD